MQDIQTVEIRQLELSDYDELQKSMKSAYDWTPAWSRDEINRLITKFPEGQFVSVADGKVVGSALSIIVDYSKFGDEHTYLQITGNYQFDTHDPDGNVLYGIDVFIHPDYRGLRLGRRLYDSRKELCEHLNLESIMFGGRLPNYHEHADELTPRQYIDQVRHKAFFDPVLTFQLSNDFHVKKVLRGYMPDDHESQEFAALLQWNNIYYTKPSNDPDHHKSIVRLGLVQWQMRNYRSLEGLYEQFDFFVDAVSAYNADFALFPEFFSAPLMAEFNELKEAEAIRKLAGFTEEIRDQFASLAISYNVNIITGSMPYLDDTGLYNVGYFCGRDGRIEMYEKIHCTPDEVQSWGLQGGNKIKVIDTDCGKIGILICYDVEFPELPRILAEQGMQILFVPFLTDTQNGYARVRNCARSRAIENECYVAIAGSVGNLPKVHNMDIQFAQSGVFTPCDFSFPLDGIKAEATPNTEMILIADVDLDLLAQLHTYGAVRNMKDRRKDLYQLTLQDKRGTPATKYPEVKVVID
jgi:predicted amidohydrolase/GNAT superfamily N-acetyltransferase